MRKCPYCGHLNESIFKYCIKCGRELPKTEERTKAEQQKKPGVYLYTIKRDGTIGESVGLKPGLNTIGTDADIVFEDPWIHPKHCTINIEKDKITIKDNNTKYGTYVRIRGQKNIHNGDQFRIGHALFEIELPWLSAVIGPDNTTWLGSIAYDDQVFGRLKRMGVNEEIEAFLLTYPSVVIGRKQGDIVLSKDPVVSGKHAQLIPQTSTEVLLKDLGSLNGTYYKIQEPYNLVDGDYLLIGGKLLLLRVIK